MKRPARKRARPIRPRKIPTGGLALTLVDSARFRREIKSDYEKVQRDLAQSRTRLDRFHQEDLPQFTRWLHRTFGVLLTDLREFARKVAEAETLILEIEQETFLTGVTYPAAYRRVLRRREQTGFSRIDPANPCGQDEEIPPSEDDLSESDPEAWFDELDREFSQTFASRTRSHQRRTTHGRAAVNKNTAGARLKELYRALARRLHPDSRAKHSDRHLEWWHQTQAAYEKGDVEQLEILLALFEIEETGHTEATSLSLLRRITRQFQKALREVKRRLQKLRRDPAWNFSRRRDHTLLEGQMRRILEEDLHQLKMQLREFEAILRSWRKGPHRSPHRNRSRWARFR